MSASAAQALAEAAIARPAELKVTPVIVTDEVPVSLRVTVRLLPPSRLMPLNPASADSVSIWARMASNWTARLARTVVSAVCCAWLISACADCTSLVIEVRPLLAAWIVLTPFDIEFEQVAEVARAVAQALRREEVDRIVERVVDALAGRQLGLGRGDEVCRLLQLQEILTDASRKNNVSHDTRLVIEPRLPGRPANSGLLSLIKGYRILNARLMRGGNPVRKEKRRHFRAAVWIVDAALISRTGGAPTGWPARRATGRWSTAAGGSAGRAGWRLPRWSRPA